MVCFWAPNNHLRKCFNIIFNHLFRSTQPIQSGYISIRSIFFSPMIEHTSMAYKFLSAIYINRNFAICKQNTLISGVCVCNTVYNVRNSGYFARYSMLLMFGLEYTVELRPNWMICSKTIPFFFLRYSLRYCSMFSSICNGKCLLQFLIYGVGMVYGSTFGSWERVWERKSKGVREKKTVQNIKSMDLDGKCVAPFLFSEQIWKPQENSGKRANSPKRKHHIFFMNRKMVCLECMCMGFFASQR